MASCLLVPKIRKHDEKIDPDLDLGFLTPFPSDFDPDEFRLKGSTGICFTSPLCGSQGHRGSYLLRGA